MVRVACCLSKMIRKHFCGGRRRGKGRWGCKVPHRQKVNQGYFTKVLKRLWEDDPRKRQEMETGICNMTIHHLMSTVLFNILQPKKASILISIFIFLARVSSLWLFLFGKMMTALKADGLGASRMSKKKKTSQQEPKQIQKNVPQKYFFVGGSLELLSNRERRLLWKTEWEIRLGPIQGTF